MKNPNVNPDWPRRIKTAEPYVLSHAQKVTSAGVPQRIQWVQIEPDGSERTRTGQVWSRAPRVKGLSAFWVIADPDTHTRPADASGDDTRPDTHSPDTHTHPDDTQTRTLTFDTHAPASECVCVIHTHRVTAAGRVRGARFRRSQGRVIHAGEWYSESHPDSPSGALTHAAYQRVYQHRVIKTEPLPPHIFATLSDENPDRG